MPLNTDHDQRSFSFVDHTLAALDDVEAAMSRLDVEKREARRRIAREHRAQGDPASPEELPGPTGFRPAPISTATEEHRPLRAAFSAACQTRPWNPNVRA
jgi:hypothetical protein